MHAFHLELGWKLLSSSLQVFQPSFTMGCLLKLFKDILEEPELLRGAWGGITGLLALWSLTSSILLPQSACLHSFRPNRAPLFYVKKKELVQLCQICLMSLPWGDEKCSSKGCCPVGVPSKRRLMPSSLLLCCSQGSDPHSLSLGFVSSSGVRAPGSSNCRESLVLASFILGTGRMLA